MGPVAIVALGVLLWIVQRYLFIPNVALLFLLVLVGACLNGGLLATVSNVVLALAGTMVLYAQVGHLFAEGEWQIRLLTPLVSFPIAAASVFTMRRRIAAAAAAPILAERLLFQAIMASMHDAIVETDWKGIRDVNASFCRMTGFAREELIGAKAPFPFWPVEQYAAIAAALETSMRGQALDFELVLTRKNGERFPVLLSVSRILEARGAANRVLYSFRDITELKRTQEQLQERERTLAQAVDAARLGTWEYDLASKRMRWGGHFEALWGLKPGEFDGTIEGATSRVLPEDFARMKDAVAEARQARGAFNAELRVIWPNDSIHWMSVMGAFVFSEKGDVVRVTGVSHEITEQRNAQLLLAGQGEILEKIARRTPLQATRVSLVQMIEQILQGSRCSILTLLDNRKRFRVAAAPTLPAGFLRIVEGLEVGPGPSCCGTAASTGKRAVARDIQADPRWALGREMLLPFELRSCTSEPILAKDGRVMGTYAVYLRDARELNASELHVLEVAAQLAAIAIEQDREERELRDAKEAAEIANRTKDRFLNLLSHELRAPLTPILTVAQMLENDIRVPEELRGDVEMIRRNAEAEAQLVDELLDLVHGAGGEVPIEAEPGLRSAREFVRGGGAQRPASTAGKLAPAKKPRKILLVDDHADTAAALKRMLVSCGHEVVIAGNVAEAVEKGTAERFDLLLSDIGLPDGTGQELLQKLGPGRVIPAIALSGFGSAQDIERSLSAGFLVHLTKPVNFEKLQDAIERFTS